MCIRDRLCHISELSEHYISDISKAVNEGDVVKVKCIGVDDHDRVKLSRKAALEELGEEDDWEPQERSENDGERRERRPRRDGDRRGGGGRRRRRD